MLDVSVTPGKFVRENPTRSKLNREELTWRKLNAKQILASKK